MERIIESMRGKRVDILCAGGGTLRGEISKINDGIVEVVCDDGRCGFVVADKIAAIVDVKENGSRPGFVA